MIYLESFFYRPVHITKPICRELDEEKADYLIFDTTGLEIPVTENNAKIFNTELKQAKAIHKKNTDFNHYVGVYSLLPDIAEKCDRAKNQYINSHYCYAVKTAVVTNELGIVWHIKLFDDEFKNTHPDGVDAKSDNPDVDKKTGDSTALKPVLSDFFKEHPELSYKTFIGDSSFDSYDIYSTLRHNFHFERACVPINPRNSKQNQPDENSVLQKPLPVNVDKNGIPLCPFHNTPFISLGKSKGSHRSICLP